MRVVVVGGGMAGVSVAYELAGRADVVLVEQEAQLAHHTTGRSAAMYLPTYGNQVVRALTAASAEGFELAERDLGAPPLLSPRRLLWVADELSAPALEARLAEDAGLVRLGPAEAVDRCPALRADRVAGAAEDRRGCDIDVLALHQAYVRGLRSRGGEIRRSACASVARAGGGWEVTVGGDRLACDVVVDAAGAWADAVARAAGVRPVGLQPLRRTLFTSPVTWPTSIAGWPLVADPGEAFYFRPEGAQLLVSPADETPSDPCDARPEEADVARALEAVNDRTTLGLRTVGAAWAGLRSFVADRSPVVGWRPGEAGFCWFAGQGGYGIQLAPALARAGASLVLDGSLPPDIRAAGVTEAALSPERPALQPFSAC